MEANFRDVPQGALAWDRLAQLKRLNQLDHGQVYLANGSYRMHLRWSRCD